MAVLSVLNKKCGRMRACNSARRACASVGATLLERARSQSASTTPNTAPEIKGGTQCHTSWPTSPNARSSHQAGNMAKNVTTPPSKPVTTTCNHPTRRTSDGASKHNTSKPSKLAGTDTTEA